MPSPEKKVSFRGVWFISPKTILTNGEKQRGMATLDILRYLITWFWMSNSKQIIFMCLISVETVVWKEGIGEYICVCGFIFFVCCGTK
jgi:hypothetical protein